MEEVLKGLQGKTITKQTLFDFLANINLEELYNGNISNTVQLPGNEEDSDIIKCAACSKTFTVENSLKRHYKRKPECVKFIETLDKTILTTKRKKRKVPVKNDNIKCVACSKTFTVENSLKRHYKRSPACVKWIETSEKSKEEKPVELKKGMHRIINDLLEKAIGGENKLRCMWCESDFINIGNRNKHLNTSTVCNRMAYNEFKHLFENL